MLQRLRTRFHREGEAEGDSNACGLRLEYAVEDFHRPPGWFGEGGVDCRGSSLLAMTESRCQVRSVNCLFF